MKIGDVVKTLRGWGKIKFYSTRLRPFSDARKTFAEIFGKIPDEEPCMFTIEVRLPPKQLVSGAGAKPETK
jgi:hypothetical protein